MGRHNVMSFRASSTRFGAQRAQTARAIWAPSRVRRLVRSRVLRAVVLVAVGVACALSLSARATALEQERASWGDQRQVAVVTELVSAGQRVEPAVELRMLPSVLVPDGAVTDLHPDSRAKVSLYPGEIVLLARTTSHANHGLDPGSVALTLSVTTRVPLIKAGDLVDLWSIDSAAFTSVRVGVNATVLAVSERDITVAVPANEAASATAASLRPVTVTLVG